MLELLRAVLAIGLDVPTAGLDPAHAADSLLLDSLAAALAPSADADAGDPNPANPDPADLRRAAWLAHYVAGTFLRRCLLRCAQRPAGVWKVFLELSCRFKQ